MPEAKNILKNNKQRGKMGSTHDTRTIYTLHSSEETSVRKHLEEVRYYPQCTTNGTTSCGRRGFSLSKTQHRCQ